MGREAVRRGIADRRDVPVLFSKHTHSTAPVATTRIIDVSRATAPPHARSTQQAATRVCDGGREGGEGAADLVALEQLGRHDRRAVLAPDGQADPHRSVKVDQHLPRVCVTVCVTARVCVCVRACGCACVCVCGSV